MDCIDCDFEKLDENDCCPQCEKTLCLIARTICMMRRKKECANIVMKIAVKYALVI